MSGRQVVRSLAIVLAFGACSAVNPAVTARSRSATPPPAVVPPATTEAPSTQVTPGTSAQPPPTDASPSTAVAPPGPADAPSASALPDPLYAELGAAGLDVHDYRVELSYDPASDQIHGRVLIQLSVTADNPPLILDAGHYKVAYA